MSILVAFHNHAARGIATGAVALLLLAGGCQTYRAAPLDTHGHRAAFLARTPDSPEVAAFAELMNAQREPQVEALDYSDGITLEEAEALALVFNADLRIARLRAGVTEASAANAGLWEDPTIGVDLTRIIQSTPHPWKLASAVRITIPISGRLEVEKKRAGGAHAAELARVAMREWQLRMELRRAWTRWAAMNAQRTTTIEFLERADQILAIVELMERAGELTRTEARLFRIEKAAKRSELALLESQVSEGALAMLRLMGLSPIAPVSLISTGIGHASKRGERESVEVMRDSLSARSPLLLAQAAEYEVAERSLELEIRKQYPDLTIGPGYGSDDGQDELLLGISLPLPILNANRRGIAEATAAREVARAEAEAALEGLVSDLQLADLRLRATTALRQSLESEIVPLVDGQYADARELARLGEVNTLVLLESLTRQQETKLRLIEAMRDEALAVIAMDEIVGPEQIAPEAEVSEPAADETNGDRS